MALDVKTTLTHDLSGNPVAMVRLVGVLDAAAAPEAQRRLAIVAAGGPKAMVLDLGELHFLDSSGISVLLLTRIAADRTGSRVLLTNLTDRVRRVLEVVQSLPGIRIFQSHADLDAFLRRVQDGAPPDER